ncbi:hypothetical protein GIB67_010093 [Kingdonia uniflora]|uniref:RRM domain-containing protein n=1 Tax=Kingdonia uniflora TaxID=39325 RepID=A0A7J7PAK9_9MAGN|nr:hypothetical protein GIB67_010093 [Kingdonia uniflora]
MMRVVLTLVLFFTMTLTVSTTPGKVNLLTLRKLALRNNLTYILVFGDSSVDPGNYNRLLTTFKGNFEPYGKNFFNGCPTGKFCNGRLPTDFIAEAIGFTKIIPGFLDLHLKKENLLHGASFASATSGYDDLSANLTELHAIGGRLLALVGIPPFLLEGLTAVTDEVLRKQFSEFGKIVSVIIPIGKGCGFVQFATKSNAEEALQGMNGTTIGKNTVRLSWGRSPANKQVI